jgi:hypothetical protein
LTPWRFSTAACRLPPVLENEGFQEQVDLRIVVFRASSPLGFGGDYTARPLSLAKVIDMYGFQRGYAA